MAKNKKFVGSSGTEIYGGFFAEEYLSKLQGSLGIDEYDKMRRSDCQVRMMLNAIKNPIKSSKWSVDKNGADDKIAEFIEWNFFHNHNFNFIKFLNEALTYLEFGFSIFEHLFAVNDHPTFGPVHYLKDMGYRSQKTIEDWVFGSKLLGVNQQALGDTATDGSSVFLDVKNLTIFSNELEGDNFEGISVLRPAYGPYFRKNLYLRLLAIGIEKSSIGTPIGTYLPGSNEDRSSFEDVLKRFTSHQESYIMIPEGYKIDIHTIPFDSGKLIEALKYEDTQMSKSILFQFLEMGTGGNGGAYALGADQSDLALSVIQYIGDYVSRELMDVGRKLIDWNFGPQEHYPEIKCTGVNKKVGKEFSEAIKSLISVQAISTDETLEKHLRTLYELPTKEVAEDAPQDTTPPADPVVKVEAEKPEEEEAKPKEDEAEADEEKKDEPKKKESDELEGFEPYKPLEFKDFFRDLTEYEGETNFQEIDELFEDESVKLNRTIKNRLNLIEEKALADLGRLLKKHPKNRTNISKELKINVDNYKKILTQAFTKIAESGWDDIAGEFKKKGVKEFASPPDAKELKKALKFLPPHVQKSLVDHAQQQAELHRGKIESIVGFTLTDAQATQASDAEILFQVEKKLDEFIASNTINIGRTLVTMNYNKGRNAFAFDPKNLKSVKALQFSAILDSRTTDICLSLDGKIFKPSDPDASRYRPPLHHNCRSILVPITINESEPVITGITPDPTNESLVEEFKKRGKPVPSLEKIKKSQNL